MKVLRALLASVVTASAAGAAEPMRPSPYAPPSRVAHIEGALAALAQTPRGDLDEGVTYARTLDHGACSAGTERLRVECLLVAVRRYCHDRGDALAARCLLYMDVVVSNVLAERRIIPPERRYAIVHANVDYRSALANEIRRIQGMLAVDFRLRTGVAEGPRALATAIDRYCLAESGDPTLTYQGYPACVSSLVWFIGAPS